MHLRLFVTLALAGNALGQADIPEHSSEYLGSKPSKAYFFPWLVSIHRESAYLTEIFGSGSILNELWVLASMDSFARNSRVGMARPFFQDIENVVIYSSGVWATPYLKEKQVGPGWLQKRKVAGLYMFSDPDRTKAKVLQFSVDRQPSGLNDLEMSPFGFSMSIALIKIQRDVNSVTSDLDRWIYRRITLPVPLVADKAQSIQTKLDAEMVRLEKSPHTSCHVGGWRLEDYRLVKHEMTYIPLERCKIAYCAYDARACHKWPVKGVHVCFKSVTFTDACPMDQGSALYCERISSSVVAILTSAPTCGAYGLPAVFTLIHHGLALFEAVAGSKEPYKPLSEEEMKKYTPPPQKDMFPVYR